VIENTPTEWHEFADEIDAWTNEVVLPEVVKGNEFASVIRLTMIGVATVARRLGNTKLARARAEGGA
jgi:hypothetical protein